MSGTPWNDYGLVAHIAKRLGGGHNLGKTKLQKLVYLLRELKGVRVGYDFRFYNYGPYSDSLSGDLGYLQSLEAVKVSYDPFMNMYDIIAGEKAEALEEKASGFLRENRADLDEVIERFGRRQAKDLELISTIVFVAKSGIRAERELISKVMELKPKFTRDEIKAALDELNAADYVLCQRQ
jgi:uncharacterized protein YwgA